MPRNVGTVINNNLSKGLITEATGMNFPDNATTDSLNVVYDNTGSVSRRKGIDIEVNGTFFSAVGSPGVVKEFVWKSISNTGELTFLVLQMGLRLYFFRLTSDNLSEGILPESVNLSDYLTHGSNNDLIETPCSFASGAGYLFVTNPYTDPLILRWTGSQDAGSSQLEISPITVMIRDFEGVEDGLPTTENPYLLSDAHHYNLRNQGWNQMVRVGTVSNELGAGGSLGGSPISPALNWQTI